MKASLLLGAAALAAPQLALGQTPPGSSPDVHTSIGLAFGNNKVHPGELINQLVADASEPTVFANRHYNDVYTIALVDLNLPFAVYPPTTDFSSLVPGLGANRTTRLHWWEQDVKRNRNNILTNCTADIAEYQGPHPPQGDIPHDYVLYVFKQPKGWKAPAGASQKYNAPVTGVDPRFNFSVNALVHQLGQPVAANYFRTENVNNTNAA